MFVIPETCFKCNNNKNNGTHVKDNYNETISGFIITDRRQLVSHIKIYVCFVGQNFMMPYAKLFIYLNKWKKFLLLVAAGLAENSFSKFC